MFAAAQYDEKYRPQFHFTPKTGWIGDPDGLVKYHGIYHLFWWGHAVSSDMVHWTQLPYPIQGHMGEGNYNIDIKSSVNSGSAVVDKYNVSGFGANTMIGFHTLDNSKEQTVGISYSHDYKNFKLYEHNPILRDSSSVLDFRDPHVFWYAPTHRWIMAIALGTKRKIGFYWSTNLKTWTHSSDFGPDGGMANDNWETPDLFQLPVDGNLNDQKWVLTIGGGADKTYYYIGSFNGYTFTNDNPGIALRMDYGKDFYATRTWQDYDSVNTRTTILGWVGNWNYSPKAPTQYTYNGLGVESIPRDLSLKKFSEGIRLVQTPIPELKQIRQKPVRIQNAKISGTHPIATYAPFSPAKNVYEIDAAFNKINPTAIFGFNICVDNKLNRKLILKYDASSSRLSIDRTHCTDTVINDSFPVIVSTNVALENNRLRLHIFVDQSTVEVFTSEGKTVFSMLTYPGTSQVGVEVFSLNGITNLSKFTGWQLHSIWDNSQRHKMDEAGKIQRAFKK